ncbi:hypothetical protein BU17DRAFT_98877 [Hysterangium stoloniferum]|nr:hypothetical protein BU17DRAFT_98877 [Hysterangium stoloniferum]
MAPDLPPIVAAPWTLTGEVYWFFPSTPSQLPEGAYAPLEATSFYASEEAGKFRGGPFGSTHVQVIRYNDSPVGPYDELIYIPGHFETPAGKANLRITRIYVSTDASIHNGRKNWNICKHKARFAFTTLEPEKSNSPVKIEVFPPSPLDAKPFFSAVATPASYVPPFPFTTSIVPMDLTLVHPPLPDGGPANPVDAGTEQWVSIVPHLKGWGRLTKCTPGGDNDGVPAGEYADGVGFPKVQPYWLGLHVTNMTVSFPEAKIVDDKKVR